MRIGVRLSPERITGVAVTEIGETVSVTRAAAASSLQESYDTFLRELLQRCARSIPDARLDADSITFDVSGTLGPRSAETASTVLLRIAPRPPIDAVHDISLPSHSRPDIMHVAGGSTTLGEELIALDESGLARAARALPPMRRFIITGVGAAVNPAQELRAGEVLLDSCNPSSIEYSHHFPSSSFATRERTALLNGELLSEANSLVTALTLVSNAHAPNARLYATTNSGGCVPLQRLTLEPVHSVLSAAPTEFLGAGAICEVEDGRVVVQSERGLEFCELSHGVPTVKPQHRDPWTMALATQTANVLPYSAPTRAAEDAQLHLVLSPDQTRPEYPTMRLCRHSDTDLRALGAAVAPLSVWRVSVEQVGNAQEMQRALDAGRAQVSARLVSYGASPSAVRIVEARVATSTYEHPRVVSVRVHGIAARHTGPLDGMGGHHVPR